jgi:Protein of unknown function (DUF3617)
MAPVQGSRMRSIWAAIAAIPISLTVASAEDLPGRKTGLWEIKTTFEGKSPAASQECVDRATDQLVRSRPNTSCSKNIRRSANSFTIETTCSFAGKTSTGRAVVTGSLESAYTMKSEAIRDVPGSGFTTEAKWLGPCKAGQKPGDVVMDNGRKFNVFEVQNAPPAAAPPR